MKKGSDPSGSSIDSLLRMIERLQTRIQDKIRPFLLDYEAYNSETKLKICGDLKNVFLDKLVNYNDNVQHLR
jgi:hypothetical protein